LQIAINLEVTGHIGLAKPQKSIANDLLSAFFGFETQQHCRLVTVNHVFSVPELECEPGARVSCVHEVSYIH
jgi:hypothetical protein